MLAQPLAHRHRLFRRDRGQVRIHARRRIGHVLAKELLPHEQSARSGRRIFRLGREREEQTLTEKPGPLRTGGERNAIELLGRNGHFIDAGQLATHVAVIGREQRHEVAIVPDQVGDKGAGLGQATAVSRVNEGNLLGPFGRQKAIETQPLADNHSDS